MSQVWCAVSANKTTTNQNEGEYNFNVITPR